MGNPVVPHTPPGPGTHDRAQRPVTPDDRSRDRAPRNEHPPLAGTPNQLTQLHWLRSPQPPRAGALIRARRSVTPYAPFARTSAPDRSARGRRSSRVRHRQDRFFLAVGNLVSLFVERKSQLSEIDEPGAYCGRKVPPVEAFGQFIRLWVCLRRGDVANGIVQAFCHEPLAE